MCYVCNTITFESRDIGSSFSHGTSGISQRAIRVKLVYEGHRVKVEVQQQKNVENPYSRSALIPTVVRVI